MKQQTSKSSFIYNEELERLCIFVHGSLVALHGLGIAYNAKRKNWIGVWLHSGSILYSVLALKNHHNGACVKYEVIEKK